jgi:hypothetical protein
MAAVSHMLAQAFAFAGAIGGQDEVNRINADAAHRDTENEGER